LDVIEDGDDDAVIIDGHDYDEMDEMLDLEGGSISDD